MSGKINHSKKTRKTIRATSSFKRKSPALDPEETVLIVCEGETEVYYFNEIKKAYRLSFIQTVLCPTGSAPINIVNYAIDYATNNEAIDRVFCVFDRDQHSTYGQALQLLKNPQFSENAKSKPVLTAITSNPCFEFWLLLHYEYTTKPYLQKASVSPAQQVIKDLKKYLPKYSKGSSTWFLELHKNIKIALVNSEKLKKENKSTKSESPATNVDKIFTDLCILRKT